MSRGGRMKGVRLRRVKLKWDYAGSWKTMERRLNFPWKGVKQWSNVICFMFLKAPLVSVLRIDLGARGIGQKWKYEKQAGNYCHSLPCSSFTALYFLSYKDSFFKKKFVWTVLKISNEFYLSMYHHLKLDVRLTMKTHGMSNLDKVLVLIFPSFKYVYLSWLIIPDESHRLIYRFT